MGDIEEAKKWFNKAKESLIKEQENKLILNSSDKPEPANEQGIISSGWNVACSLLKKGDMTTGWSLYNYGLHTPAPGLQRWQRACQNL